MERLIIPKSKQTKGLYVFCNQCKNKSKSFLKLSSNCNHPIDKQRYKVLLTIPGTTSLRTKTLKTKDIDEAIKATLDFERSLQINDYKSLKEETSHDSLPQDLKGCIQMYLDYLNNDNVFEHQKKKRSPEHVKQIIRYLKRFILALKENKVNLNRLLIRHINNEHVAMFHNYITKYYSPSNRTYNRHMDTISEFFKYLIEIKHYRLINYFSSKNVIRKRTTHRIETISKDEFNKLLDIITPEDGIETLESGEKKYHYQEWLKDAFQLALLTGRRRDEVINMKFSDIHEKDGHPIYIVTEDHKYNQRNNLYSTEDKKYIYTPVIPELRQLLIKIGYKNYKGQDRYIIAPKSNRTRTTLKDNMSKAFTHYFKQLNSDKNLAFKNLRKTYITLLNNYTGGNAEVITGHSGQKVIMGHYHDTKVYNDTLNGFRLMV
ncbi:tyrosine-type recombinase/integrase [Saccharicrinis sp. FJH54]|uniref:tyrosine-type recombinase/integrase n=1 Tax=Saccharicrinis sp. FJH54 TaxID=3344665 RepID=UPI0035D453FF